MEGQIAPNSARIAPELRQNCAPRTPDGPPHQRRARAVFGGLEERRRVARRIAEAEQIRRGQRLLRVPDVHAAHAHDVQQPPPALRRVRQHVLALVEADVVQFVARVRARGSGGHALEVE